MNRTFPVGILVVGAITSLAGGLVGNSADAAMDDASMIPMQCGTLRISVGFEEDTVRLVVGDETFEMHSVIAASGARYEALDDPSTSFWSKGENALFELRGKRYPECTKVDTTAFRATSNEPGWRLDIGTEELTLSAYYGETRITAPTPEADTTDESIRYVVTTAEHELTVTVFDRVCTDTMSGMPHPNKVIIVLDGEELNGCGGDPATLLQGDEWVVEDIDGGGTVDRSQVTIEFGDDGRVSGAASCNRFMGGYSLTGEGLTLSRMASTMMACPEALMDQESRFLEILGEVQRFELDESGALVLHTNDGRTITARR